MKEFAVTHVSQNYIFAGERHFLEALTRWNYFPNQRASVSELPPSICTRRFTPEIALKLHADIEINKERKTLGFDLVEYRATRYNNVSRILGLIHPLAFSKIFAVAKTHRIVLETAMQDANSAIHVDWHLDGRMLIMNYEDHEEKVLTSIEKSFGKKFRAHTDVANCFGSIYTHSLEWAVQGFAAAKSKLALKDGSSHWSSELDRALRCAKRNETSGLPIGPASSSIAVEVILAAVDRELRKNFEFVRYIDDYTALCSSYDEAQEFIRVLGKELSQYRLTLNLSKTSIVELPEPLQEKWVSGLMSALPSSVREDRSPVFLSTEEAFQFLDHAVRLNNETPDGSVIKFAVAAISRKLEGKTAADVFQYVLNLAWHYPVLLPYLEQIDARSEWYEKDWLIEKLNRIIDTNVSHRRSDGICWALYYLQRINAAPSDDAIAGIIESKDCLALSMLCNFETAIDRVTAYAKEIAEASLYIKDQNWLLLYQLYRMEKIPDPYESEATFALLKKYDVDFFCPVGETSRAEQFCVEILNPFVEPEEIPTFDQWMQQK